MSSVINDGTSGPPNSKIEKSNLTDLSHSVILKSESLNLHDIKSRSQTIKLTDLENLHVLVYGFKQAPKQLR